MPDEVEKAGIARAAGIPHTPESLHLQAFYASAVGNVLVRFEDGVIIEINAAYAQCLGYQPEELIGRPIATLQFLPSAASEGESAEAFSPEHTLFNKELRFVRRDGSIGYGMVCSHPLWIEGVQFGLGTLIDVTQRKQMEESLRDSQMRLQAALEAGGMGTWIWDVQTGEVLWDDAAFKLLGRSPAELADRRIETTATFVHPEDRMRLEGGFGEFLRTGVMEFRTLRPDGQLQWISSRGRLEADADQRPFRMAGAFVDVTARRRGEEALLRSQKMEALGTLAGGVAHDFNNILLAITGNAKLALDDLPVVHAVRRSLEEIQKASARGADLVRRILSFSRQDEPNREVSMLQPVIDEATRLLRATLPAAIRIEVTLDASVRPVEMEAVQVHQMILNLATNAAYAIGDRNGVIGIELKSIEIEAEAHAAAPDLPRGRCALIRVSDNGCGMDSATRDRIFDPFFTTKPVGQGTGLGLSVVHTIVKNHHGAITIYSQPGKGTTFLIYLPIALADVAEFPAAPREMPKGNQQHVLYIDDEDSLIFLATRLLEKMHYRVTSHVDGARALADFRARPQEFDAVVTDFSMPGMSGLDVAREILAIRPDVPIILTSGYIRAEERERALQSGIREFILKPNTVEELCFALHRCFGQNFTTVG